MQYYTKAMLKHFEASCDVKFPCEDQCEKDYEVGLTLLDLPALCNIISWDAARMPKRFEIIE